MATDRCNRSAGSYRTEHGVQRLPEVWDLLMDANDLINDDITGYLAAKCQEKIWNGEMPTEEEIEAYVYEFKRSPFAESQETFRHLFSVMESRCSE